MCDSTCSVNTIEFLQRISASLPVEKEKVAIYIDPNSSHTSRLTQGYLVANNLLMRRLPPHSSPLNHVEHCWSSLKVKWGKWVGTITDKYDFSKLEKDVESVVDDLKNSLSERYLYGSDKAYERVK